MIREVVFDTETTGLEPAEGHRVVEIGALELINHVPTGRSFHVYLNPERGMDAAALQVHGITSAFLEDQPVFAEVADDFLAFIDQDREGQPSEAKLIAHNAAFDVAFMNMELERAGRPPLGQERVIDSLLLARQRFPGAPNSLDALCRRFEVDTSARVKHGALLDAELLADCYLWLIGGRQPDLGLTVGPRRAGIAVERPRTPRPPRPHAPHPAEVAAHEAFLDKLDDPIWRT